MHLLALVKGSPGRSTGKPHLMYLSKAKAFFFASAYVGVGQNPVPPMPKGGNHPQKGTLGFDPQPCFFLLQGFPKANLPKPMMFLAFWQLRKPMEGSFAGDPFSRFHGSWVWVSLHVVFLLF